jgi:hypothetical protein
MGKTTSEKLELLFENLNTTGSNLEYLEARSPSELLNQIKMIRQATKILSIYNYGNIHIAWILTEAKIKRKGK